MKTDFALSVSVQLENLIAFHFLFFRTKGLILII